MNNAARTTPCPPSPELTAFESRIREAGEPAARLERLADLAVGLLEARRDHLLASRADACHTVVLFDRTPTRIKVLESQYAAELWAEDHGELRGYLGDELGVVEEVVFEGEVIGVIRVATEREVAERFDGGDYFDAVGA